MASLNMPAPVLRAGGPADAKQTPGALKSNLASPAPTNSIQQQIQAIKAGKGPDTPAIRPPLQSVDSVDTFDDEASLDAEYQNQEFHRQLQREQERKKSDNSDHVDQYINFPAMQEYLRWKKDQAKSIEAEEAAYSAAAKRLQQAQGLAWPTPYVVADTEPQRRMSLTKTGRALTGATSTGAQLRWRVSLDR